MEANERSIILPPVLDSTSTPINIPGGFAFGSNIMQTLSVSVLVKVHEQGFIQDFFVGGEGGGDFLYYCRVTMWLIDYSEGEGVGGGCALRSLLFDTLFDCQIYIVDQ